MEMVNEIAKLLSIEKIYLEPDVRQFKRGREILEKFPDAIVTEVPSHWSIPSLHGNEGLDQHQV